MSALGPLIDDPFSVIGGGERGCDPLSVDDPFAVLIGIANSRKHARDDNE